MNKRFEHNDLVDSAPMPSPIMRLAIKEEKDHGSSSGPLSTRLEKIADMDPYKKTQKMLVIKLKGLMSNLYHC